MPPSSTSQMTQDVESDRPGTLARWAVVPVLKGCLTLIPGVYRAVQRLRDTSATGPLLPARYFYSVWLRHLVMAWENGLSTAPRVVAEFGPGSALGVGLSALLTGAERYVAFDIVRHPSPRRNLAMLDELAALYRERADIPGDEEFPEVEPKLASYRFPHHVLKAERLDRALDPERIAELRRAISVLVHEGGKGSRLRYIVPWHSVGKSDLGSVDMLLSQAVLEHVDDLPVAYRSMYRLLSPGGFMSHTIDYRCHGTARQWNGHWKYSDFTWNLVFGRRPYLINRAMHSWHLGLIEELGFETVFVRRLRLPSEIDARHLAPSFRNSETDQTVSGAFIQALRPAEHRAGSSDTAEADASH